MIPIAVRILYYLFMLYGICHTLYTLFCKQYISCFVLRVPHQFIAELFGYTISEIVDRVNSKYTLIQNTIPNFPLKPKFFEDVSSKTMCFPAFKSFSTLDDNPEETAAKIASNRIGSFSPDFAPYICGAANRNCKYNRVTPQEAFRLNHGYYEGWRFTQDRPGEIELSRS
jgi:hypothetical protein